ncbi:hypothetical protein ICW40_16970, partial [Actinotalea ferrariae]|uniref:hypothetical protein n=1 Tax=Actinotalea ferrariae TaxID=1386098 RepID=UPI001C8CAF38
MELVDVARALHALPPEDFTAARTARSREARAAGDRELATQVGALRRPTASAWLVNRLVREDADRVRDLLALGARMAEAQRTFAGPDLRALGREQHRLLGDLREALAGEGPERGGPWTETVLGQVESTLRAAMADDDAAEAVSTGLLTTHLSSTGFEPVTIEGAVAVPGAPSLLGDAPARTTAAPTGSTTEAADDDAVVTLPGARRAAARTGSRPARRTAPE